jgi:hypothetical protein
MILAKKNARLVPPVLSKANPSGGRKIRVLLESGRSMNGPRVQVNIPAKEVPMEDLKAAKAKVEEEEGPADSVDNSTSTSKQKRSSESSPPIPDSPQSTSSTPERTTSESLLERQSGDSAREEASSPKDRPSSLRRPISLESNRKDSTDSSIGMAGTIIQRDHQPTDEITPSPHPARDIRFGDLPHPRQLAQDERNESAIDDSEETEPRRGITIGEPPERRGSMLRMRRATNTGFQRVATFEKVLSNAFRRRREGSPSSRRSSRSNMTLPYFTFTPTVGRNSVPPPFLTLGLM